MVIVAGISFYGGTLYQSNVQRTAFGAAGMPGARGTFGMMNAGYGQPGAAGQQVGGRSFTRTGGMMGSGVVGEILAKDATSITVKLADGGSKIVLLSGSTSISRMAPAAATDLVVGQQVQVSGTANQDGSITAQSVRLSPTSTK
jgi:hypothetical protein